MAAKGLETEVKFYISDLKKIDTRLQELGARLVQPRVHEQNLRFDTADGNLAEAKQVLRLRQDTAARLTFKGPQSSTNGITSRQEFEFSVDDFEQARNFLQALGYQVIFFYEKYRTTYALEDTEIMLDEMPYGNFIEIEGDDPKSIRKIANSLALHWETAIPISYAALFTQLKETRDLSFRDLSFDNCSSLSITDTDLGVTASDG